MRSQSLVPGPMTGSVLGSDCRRVDQPVRLVPPVLRDAFLKMPFLPEQLSRQEMVRRLIVE